LSKSDALTLTFELRQQLIRLALELLHILRLDNLGERLLKLYPEKEPGVHAINHICDRINFKIWRPYMLEFARRHYSNGERILVFLIRHEELLHCDPPLIWNARETQLNSLKRFRALCQNGILPLASTIQQLPHITELVSINADGVALDPIVVLKSLQTLGNLEDLQSHCDFTTHINGWTIKGLWTYFALAFGAQISYYRLTLPPQIRNDDMSLIIDGHKTQLNLTAALIFW
jgi:hypothetical protein